MTDDPTDKLFQAASSALMAAAKDVQTAAAGKLSPVQIARMFARVAFNMLVPAMGPLAAAQYLRTAADALDRGDDIGRLN